jgi:hypothetical protein
MPFSAKRKNVRERLGLCLRIWRDSARHMDAGRIRLVLETNGATEEFGLKYGVLDRLAGRSTVEVMFAGIGPAHCRLI